MILLDNGHGYDTPGKRSPRWSDGSILYEYEFNRNIVRRIAAGLAQLGIEFKILVPETWDISLPERCRRANKYEDAILVSVHANAGGGTGFEIFTSPGDTKADPLATIFFQEAQKELSEFKARTDYSDQDPDKEAAFYILKHTKCPAILTENLFMDTEEDCRFIMSDTGRMRIANYHINAIKKIYDGKTT